MVEALMSDELSRKGNFGKSILTNSIYDSTRINLEFLLSKNKGVNVYNTADGAYIELTKPTKIEGVELSATQENKQMFLNQLLHDAFDNKQLALKSIDRTVEEILYVLKVTLEQLILKMDKKVNSREELADIFADQYRLLKMLFERDEYIMTD